MKTKKILGLAILALLLTTLKSIAQPIFPLTNSLPCDVEVAVEIGDISQCSFTPPNFVYTPCNSYSTTIPANSTIWVNACTGILPSGVLASGNLDELCIIVLEIGGTPVASAPHSNSGTGCCTMPFIPFATGLNTPGCGPVTWTILRTLTGWTIF